MDEAANGHIISRNEAILVTGANGFVGSRVVWTLLSAGFARVRCVTRPASDSRRLEALRKEFGPGALEIIKGNLLSRDTCEQATRGVAVVYHLAAGIDKSFTGCFLNSVVTTRNLLEAVTRTPSTLKRFVNISSLSVYSNEAIRRRGVLDETCEIESDFVARYDPYAYGKAKQDEIVRDFGRARHLPYVIVRPGVVFGPDKAKIPGRVGIDTFGVFLHVGLGNRLPLTYVDNCAEAVMLAGLRPGIEQAEINVVDDDLPSSWYFLRGYKFHVRRFVSVPVPYRLFYLLNFAWEKYSVWSDGQLPPAFNRKTCEAYFKGNAYPNQRAKDLLGWRPRVPMSDGLSRFYAYARAMAVPK